MFCILELPLVICNGLTACKLYLSRLVQLFSHCFITVILQLWDWSALFLLERDGEICRITAHCFVELTTLTIDLAVLMPGILLLTFILLIPVTLKHWTDISVAGKFQLSTFGTHCQLIYSSLELPMADVPY